jgi:hypothetical protein
MEAEHTALLYYCATRWLSPAEVPQGICIERRSGRFVIVITVMMKIYITKEILLRN